MFASDEVVAFGCGHAHFGGAAPQACVAVDRVRNRVGDVGAEGAVDVRLVLEFRRHKWLRCAGAVGDADGSAGGDEFDFDLVDGRLSEGDGLGGCLGFVVDTDERLDAELPDVLHSFTSQRDLTACLKKRC